MTYKEGNTSYCTDDRCYHYEQRRISGRLHSKLAKRHAWYHNWHHHPHHKKVHGVVAVLHTAIMIAVVVANAIPGGVLAATNVWSFGTPADYAVSDAALAEVAGSTAKLKVRNYTPDANTVALYHLDEANGSSAADSSGNNNTGTVTGGTFGTGNLNNGLALNGTTGKISVPDSASLSLSQSNTIEAWTKFDSSFSNSSHSQRQGIVDKGDYQLYYNHESGKVVYELADASPEWEQVAGRHAGSLINNGPDPTGPQYTKIVNSGSTIYALMRGIGTANLNFSQVWRWNGSTWTQIGGDGINSSWGVNGDIEDVRSAVVMGTDLYVGTGATVGDGDVWKWNGSVWSKIGGDGLNASWTANTVEWVYSLETDGTNLYAGTGLTAGDGDVWKWNGSTWAQIGGDNLNSGWAAATVETVYALEYFGGNLYAGTGLTAGDGDVWMWNGTIWAQIGGDNLNSGWAAGAIEYVFSLENDGTNLYAGTGLTAGDGDVWKWNGTIWAQIGGDNLNSGWAAATIETVESLYWDGTTLYAGIGTSSADGEIWSWNGSIWAKILGDGINSGETPEEITDIISISGTLYAATEDSSDGAQVWSWNGSAWTQIGGEYLNESWGYFAINQISSLATGHGYLYAGTGNTTGDAMVWRWDGATWTLIAGQGQNNSWARNTFEEVSSMTTYKNNLYVGLGNSAAGEGDVWKWDGATWTQIGGDGLNSGPAASTYEAIRSMTIHNGLLVVGLGGTNNADNEVWTWDDSIWAKIGGDGTNGGFTGSGSDSINALVSWEGALYAGTNGSAGEGEVWKYTGGTWSQVGGDNLNSSWDNVSIEGVQTLTVYNGNLYAGLSLSTGDADVWQYNGTTWTQIGGDFLNSGWEDNFEIVRSLATYNGELYASLGNSTGDSEVWKWNGTSWSKVAGDGLNDSWQGSAQDSAFDLTVYQGKLYVGLGETAATDAAIWSYGKNAVLHSSATSQDTNWHHIAATYDGVTMKLYIDGSLDASLAAGTTMPNSDRALLIGAAYGGSASSRTQGFFQGQIDEVRISNTARASFVSAPYATTPQTVQPTAAVLTNGVSTWDGFSTSETLNGGTITYRLSSDGGTTWKYYTGGAWTTSASTSNANAASVINTNIPTFPVTSGGVLWQAVLTGNGSQAVTLNSVTVTYTGDSTAPTNPTATTGENSNGGGVSLTTDTWYNHTAPYFSWTGAADPGGSGVQGYFVYFGTDNTADPTTAGAFQAGANYTAGNLVSGSTYYLRIKTRDVAQNVSATAYSAFTYKYDATVPTNPTFVSVNPSGYTSTNNFTFIWPSTGGSMATDAHSGVAGYQYKTGAASGPLSTYSATTGVTEINIPSAAYQEGANTFYLRVIDTAGNASNPITATYYYNASAPTAPQNVNATPGTNTANAFAFSWTAPASFSGNASELVYYYSVNTLPSISTVTEAGNVTSLSAGPFATQQGTNTFYVVAKDAANNINYSAYGSATFTANTVAPGQPLNLTIADSSNRASSQYRLSLTWEAPTSGGSVHHYAVHRSTNNVTFASIGTTASTGYIDTGLATETTYSYKIFAIDSAGATSVASSVASKKPTGKFTEPPSITTPPTAVAGATSVTITWTTSRASDAFVEYGTSTDYGLNYGQREDKTDHKVTITGLTPGTMYHYRVQSLDSGDLRDYDSTQGRSDDFTFETTAAPGLSNVTFSDITTNSAILSFDTSKAATSTIEYGTSTNYGSTITDESGGGTTKHTLRLKDLLDGTTYQMRISIKDSDGNTVSSPGHAFTTLAKPKISDVRFETLPNTAQTTVKVTWTTNVATTGSVQYSSDTAKPKEVATSEYKTEHEFIVSGLLDQSTYQFQAISRDTFGNTAASDTNSVKTPSDSRPPELKNLTVEVRSSGVSTGQKAQLVVSWETDEPATSMIEYGPGLSSDTYTGRSQEDTALTTTHVVIVSELEPSKLYHLRAVSKDRAGNPGLSADTTAITGKMQRSVVDIILNSLQRSFSFFSKIAK